MRAFIVIVGLAAAVPSSAPAQGLGSPSGFDPALCRYLPAHRPAPDVEYTPGVDVHGKAVAPADLPGSAGAVSPLDRFDLPVTAAFARRLGFAVPRGLPPSTEFGSITIAGGRVLFNGEPLDGAGTAQLYAICGGR